MKRPWGYCQAELVPLIVTGTMAYMCQWIILLLTRPYELLSEAVAMGNTKAKEQIGYFHLVSVDEQLVMLVTI